MKKKVDSVLKDEDFVSAEEINKAFPIKQMTKLLEKHGFKCDDDFGVYSGGREKTIMIRLVTKERRGKGFTVMISFFDVRQSEYRKSSVVL